MTTLTAFKVPPQQEFKAAKELRQAGHRAYLPTERHGKRKSPVARGYIFATGKPSEAKHVRQRIGDLPRASLIRLYPRRDRGHEAPEPFKAGDSVLIERGPFAALSGIVVTKRGKRGWLVDVAIFGTKSRCTVATHYMRKHDPG